MCQVSFSFSPYFSSDFSGFLLPYVRLGRRAGPNQQTSKRKIETTTRIIRSSLGESRHSANVFFFFFLSVWSAPTRGIGQGTTQCTPRCVVVVTLTAPIHLIRATDPSAARIYGQSKGKVQSTHRSEPRSVSRAL